MSNSEAARDRTSAGEGVAREFERDVTTQIAGECSGRRERLGVVPQQPRRPVKGGDKFRRYVRDAQMPCLVVLQSLEACRSNLARYVLIDSSVYCGVPLRYVFDTVERGCFFER